MDHKYDASVTQKQADATAEIVASDLANKTYTQVDTYIENNVTDLASAKVVIKKMAKLMLAILKRQDWSS